MLPAIALGELCADLLAMAHQGTTSPLGLALALAFAAGAALQAFVAASLVQRMLKGR